MSIEKVIAPQGGEAGKQSLTKVDDQTHEDRE
jgi:hypothetical protein